MAVRILSWMWLGLTLLIIAVLPFIIKISTDEMLVYYFLPLILFFVCLNIFALIERGNGLLFVYALSLFIAIISTCVIFAIFWNAFMIRLRTNDLSRDAVASFFYIPFLIPILSGGLIAMAIAFRRGESKSNAFPQSP